MGDEAAEAARVTDQVKHSNAMMGVLLGVLAGVAIAAAVVATGGAAAVVIGAALCTGASLGGTIGQLVGKHIPGPDCGPISKGVQTVFIEHMFAAVVTSPVSCNGPPIGNPHPTSQIAQGSSNVFIGKFPAARKGDKASCGAKIGSGATTVWIGGKKTTYLPIDPEVPAWVDYGLMALGILGGYGFLARAGFSTLGIVCRLGGGLIGGGFGSYGGSKVADFIGLDEDSWARDGLVVGGGVVGGGLGFKGGTKVGLKNFDTPMWKATATDFYTKYDPTMTPKTLKSHLDGIDFTKPVKVVGVPPEGIGPNNNSLYQYTRTTTNGTVLRGDYYTNNPKATADMLGVAKEYNVPSADRSIGLTDAVASRQQQLVDFNNPVQALKSTAAPINDTWSFKNGVEIPTKGGGVQLYIPKVQITKP